MTPRAKKGRRAGHAKRAAPEKRRRKAGQRPPRPARVPLASTRSTPKGRALDAVAEMRRGGKSLSKAAKAAHTTLRTIQKYTPAAVGPKRGGRYTTRAADRITRPMRFLTPGGLIELRIRSSASASRIAEFWNAVDRYLRTGRTDALHRFRGKAVRLNGVAYPFVTNPRDLDRLANAGEVRFEDLYSLTA